MTQRADPYRQTPLELATGRILQRGGLADLPEVPLDWSPLDGLAAAIRPALERPPCLVSFSGGRDSSAVLAAAVTIARREGQPLPIPITLSFPGVAESDERTWQERVVEHLRLDDWSRLEVDVADYNVLGPVAASLLRRHGVLWPPNVHVQLPLIEAARGGTIVSGLGGDEIFGGVRWARTAAVLERRVRPRPRDALGVGYALAPPFVRRAALRRSPPHFGAWLRPEARRQALGAAVAHAATEPFAWSDRLRWWLRQPYIEVELRNSATLAGEHDVTLVHPLLDPRFVACLARLPRDRRYVTRTEGMRLVFEGLLPDDLLKRNTKATFNHVETAAPRLELVERWNGEGVDETLVDVDALRREWSKPEADGSSTGLLQSAWLALDRAAPSKPAELGSHSR